MMRAVITGANRGIGLELVRQLLLRGWLVEAGARSPAAAEALDLLARSAAGRLRVHQLDVGNEGTIAELARALGAEAVDLLVNNAGIAVKHEALAGVDANELLNVYRINAVGPVLVTRALLPALRRGEASKVVHISSGMGSIGDNRSGGAYGYRMSKAALNMASRNLAIDLKSEGIVSVVLNPGWVRTDMGGPRAPLAVEDSVRMMLARIEALSLEQSGQFLNYDGNRYEW